MFKFLKRYAKPNVPPAKRRKPAGKSDPADVRLGPDTLPQVTEGNEPTDWVLWEDSVAALDSQMQSLMPSARIYENPDQSSKYQDIDAFARVTKKDA